MSPSIAHHPILPLDNFAGIVQHAGLQRVAVSAGAVDAFGAIRFRSLTERLGLTVAAIHGPGEPARIALLAGILVPEPATDEVPVVTLDAQDGGAQDGGAQDGGLADLVGALPTGAAEIHLDPACWQRLARVA